MFKKRLGVVGLVFVLLLGWAIPGASAGATTFSGTLDAGDPDMPVVLITPPVCSGQGAFPVSYESHYFVVDTAGNYTLDLSSPGDFASFYLYAGSFNPADGTANCVAADNAAPVQVTYALNPGMAYYAVVFDDTFTQLGGSYSLTISGPGNIFPSGLPGPDLVPIPAGSVVGMFVATTPAYFAPRLDAVTSTILDAGKTLWVYGVDSSGAFYQVMMSGKLFWVPVSTMGPNPDAVWHNTPLPTQVVESSAADGGSVSGG